jgi:hypothetical protein
LGRPSDTCCSAAAFVVAELPSCRLCRRTYWIRKKPRPPEKPIILRKGTPGDAVVPSIFPTGYILADVFVAYWLLYPPLLEPLSLWLIPCGSSRISFQRANWVSGQRCSDAALDQAKDWTDHGCRGNGRLPFDRMAGRPTIAFCKVCARHSKQIQALVERSLAYWSKQPPESSFFPLRLRSIRDRALPTACSLLSCGPPK